MNFYTLTSLFVLIFAISAKQLIREVSISRFEEADQTRKGAKDLTNTRQQTDGKFHRGKIYESYSNIFLFEIVSSINFSLLASGSLLTGKVVKIYRYFNFGILLVSELFGT